MPTILNHMVEVKIVADLRYMLAHILTSVNGVGGEGACKMAPGTNSKRTKPSAIGTTLKSHVYVKSIEVNTEVSANLPFCAFTLV